MEPGSAQIIATDDIQLSITGSEHLLLRIDGDPEKVVRAYDEQLRTLAHGDTYPVRHLTDGDLTVWTATTGQAGGWAYDMVVHQRKGEPAWGEISAYND